MSKLRVDLEELVKVKQYLRDINNTPLEDIEWYYADKHIPLFSESLKEWKYCGLNNTSFADPWIDYNEETGKIEIVINKETNE